MNLPKADYESHTNIMSSHINVGYGDDVTIADLARLIAKVVEFDGQITFDSSRQDGAPRKLLDCSKLLSMGWQPRVGLENGIPLAYSDFLLQSAQSNLRG